MSTIKAPVKQAVTRTTKMNTVAKGPTGKIRLQDSSKVLVAPQQGYVIDNDGDNVWFDNKSMADRWYKELLKRAK